MFSNTGEFVMGYKIPIIPPLNFKKDDENHYNFKINEGGLFHKNKKYFKLSDINIDIHDSITISCKIHVFEIKAPFSMRFSDVNNVQFNIKCSTDEYDIHIHGFHINDDTFNMEKYTHNVVGICDEIIFIHKGYFPKNGIKKVWSILEYEGLYHPYYERFKSKKLNEIYLKSCNTQDFEKEDESAESILKFNELIKKQHESFNQLLDKDTFLYYEFKDSEEKFIEIINNFDDLFRFYDSNLLPSRMKIIEYENNKLEIKIKSKNVHKTKGHSIFKDISINFINFINSVYDTYCESKNDVIDIDYLLDYYVWIKNESYLEVRLILCSAFMEVLKNNKQDTSKKNQRVYFNKELTKRFLELRLDTTKILEILQNEIFVIINNIENKFLLFNHDKRDVHLISNFFKRAYVVTSIEVYRNKVIHSGKFELTANDVDELVIKVKSHAKKVFNKNSQKTLIDLMYDEINQRLYTSDCLKDIVNQAGFFEDIVEIILLSYLKVNCNLNFPIEGDNSLYRFNSKRYINNFKLNE